MSCHGFIILPLIIILNLQHHTPAAPAPVHSRGEHRDPDCSLKHLIGGYDDYDYGDYDYHGDYCNDDENMKKMIRQRMGKWN